MHPDLCPNGIQPVSCEIFVEVPHHGRECDGLDPDLVRQANLVVSFSPMVWPHQLVRIMLAEQLYRATTILSGHPYHRA